MFDRYRKEKGIFRFEDYRVLMDYAAKARSVIEFGPGISTLALLEAGCERIASCEHAETWFSSMAQRYAAEPRVTVYRYFNTVPVTVDQLPDDEEFDLAFVDSPKGDGSRLHVRHEGQEDCSRLNTLEYALTRARTVLLHDARRDGEQKSLASLKTDGHRWRMIETLKGMAIIERKKT